MVKELRRYFDFLSSNFQISRLQPYYLFTSLYLMICKNIEGYLKPRATNSRLESSP